MDATCDNKNSYQQQIKAIKTGVYLNVGSHKNEQTYINIDNIIIQWMFTENK